MKYQIGDKVVAKENAKEIIRFAGWEWTEEMRNDIGKVKKVIDCGRTLPISKEEEKSIKYLRSLGYKVEKNKRGLEDIYSEYSKKLESVAFFNDVRL